ncbi:MAG: pullulanase-type alpha-1,6-glucosidase [Myxococcales bacterium]|nr:pullulanase-type alpha-1,6-glucosidase [Myxococcales bacterium]
MPIRRGRGLLLCFALAAGCKSETKVSNAFTLHYHRALGGYDGWTVQPTAGAVETSATATRTDGFGAIYSLTVKPGATALTFTLNNGSTADSAGALSVDVSGAVREAWVFSGFAQAIPRKPPALPASNSQVALYYLRGDGKYSGWGLHLWGDQVTNTQWGSPLQAAGADVDLGDGFLIDIKPGAPAGNCRTGKICFIVHNGDTKDPGPDMSWDRSALGDIVFVTSGSATITPAPRKVGSVTIEGASAHLLARDTLAWNVTDPAATSFELRYSATAEIAATNTDITGGSAIALTPRAGGLGAIVEAAMPQFAGWRAFDVAAADLPKLHDALKGQIVAVARKADGTPFAATQVQIPYVLDDLYAYDGPLGVTFATVAGAPTFQLWAPTAQSLKLHVYDAGKSEIPGSPIAMTGSANGVWTASGPSGWYGGYYRYELAVYHPATGHVETVLVTDPYSVNLSPNGLYSQIVDLADPALKPAGWDSLVKPALARPEDIVVYEGHIRDFSATDATVPAAERGKYLAFTESGSDGMKHLTALASAGLTHMHLLPAFDFATVDEDPANRVDLTDTFDRLCAKNTAVPAALCTQFTGKTIAQAIATFAGDSDQQQAISGYLRALDSFNWGYDPFHYGAPEGSYASTAEGTAKIVEFRKMVQGLAAAGLRTVMDVVYNHTNAAGLSDKSVLDKVVPGYYHRLDTVTGYVESSSCCANTATEHHMMGRLMADTLVRWARDYKVDGFRFDLMGLHLKSDILAAQAALQALTIAHDGVDGSKIYLYGEGWDMGEMARNGRGVNANQVNMAGTGIGTFNDRLRDAARGGGPFDNGCDLTRTPVACDIRKNQGFSSGLFTDPNELNAPPSQADQDKLGHALDLIEIGMAGSLADFRMLTFSGSTVVAAAVGYNGASAGYTQLPRESINYVSSHDNQILWDIVQYKMPTGRTTAERVRADELAMDVVLLGEGIPFFHMGDDLLRSKSMDKNSYDSGDWFNRVDWTLQGNGWKSGLPNQPDDAANWTLIKTIFGDASIAPGPSDIAASAAHFQEMLKIRKSSPLFRLAAKSDVLARVDFPNAGPSQVPGVVVMTISDGTCAGADLDPARDGIVVVVNADKASHAMAVPGATGFTLHSVQQASADPTVRTASFSSGTFTVPARTTAVFEQLQAGAQGTGLPCNTR